VPDRTHREIRLIEELREHHAQWTRHVIYSERNGKVGLNDKRQLQLFLGGAQLFVGAEKVQSFAAEEGAHSTQCAVRLLPTELREGESFPRRQLGEWKRE
jgi:hypothetical protein